MTDTPDRWEPDAALLAHYLAGTLSAEERARVDAWAASDPRYRRELEQLSAGWDGAIAVPTAAEVRASRNEVLARIGETPALSLVRDEATSGHRRGARFGWPTSTVPRQRQLVRYGLALAAGFALAAVGIRVARTGSVAGAGAGLTEYATTTAERASVTLLDGTRVVLGPASRIQVVLRGDRGTRDVYLDGEALFTVRHDAARPFTVHTASAETHDIGTTFDVRAYAGEGGTRVVVSEGRVALRAGVATAARDSALLSAGDLGRVADNGDVARVQQVPVDDYLGWASGRLVFNYSPLREALPELGRWYGLDVRLADSTLADRRISATFTTESPTQVLAMLGKSLGLEFERHGQKVTVRRP
jgi:transmembrane sensor